MSTRRQIASLVLIALVALIVWWPGQTSPETAPGPFADPTREAGGRATLSGEFDGDVVPTPAPRYDEAAPTDRGPWGLRCTVHAPAAMGLSPTKWANATLALTLAGGPEGVLERVEGKTDELGRCDLGPLPATLWAYAQGNRAASLRLEATHSSGASSRQALSLLWLRREVAEAEALQMRTAQRETIWVPIGLTQLHIPRRRFRTVTRDGVELFGLWIKGSTQPSFPQWNNPRLYSTHWMPPGHEALDVVVYGSFQLTHAVTAPSGAEEDGVTDVVVDDESIVEGRAVGVDGKPLSGVHIVLAPDKAGPNASDYMLAPDGTRIVVPRSMGRPGTYEANQLGSVTDARGRFSFAGLRAGQDYYLFWGDAQDHWHLEARPVRRGDPAVEVRIEQHGFRIEARDAESGALLEDAKSVVKRLTSEAELGYAPAKISPRGPFRLGRIGERFDLAVSCRGYRSMKTTVTLDDQPPRTIVVKLERLATPPGVRVAFVDERGQPVHMAALDIEQQETGARERG